MENAIRHVIRSMIKEPVIKELIEDELQKHQRDEQESTLILLKNNNLSKLTITKDCRIFLNDYNIEIDIQGYQARTLYLFYLLSPIGVSNIGLAKYKDILKTIYIHACKLKTCDEYRAEIVISGLLTRKSGISDATNKILKALRKVIDNKQILHFYTIKGNREDKRQILLPKQFINIEDSVLHNTILQIIESK